MTNLLAALSGAVNAADREMRASGGFSIAEATFDIRMVLGTAAGRPSDQLELTARLDADTLAAVGSERITTVKVRLEPDPK